MCYDPDRLEAQKIVEALGSVGYPAVYSLRSTAKRRGFAGRARGAHGDGARRPRDFLEVRKRGHATQAPPSDTERSF